MTQRLRPHAPVGSVKSAPPVAATMGIRIAVIGTGYWGRNHVRTLVALRQQGLIETLVVCDVDAARAHAMAEEFDATPHTDAATLHSAHGIQAVTICTPSPSHAPLALQAIEQGIHVLVEKPLAMTADDAREVTAAAAARGTVLMVGHLFRYHPAVREAAQMVAAGTLGPIHFLESERIAVREARPDMGAIHALSVHDHDVCCDVLGGIDPSRIMGITLPSHLPGIEDHAVTTLWFPPGSGGNPQGVVATCTASWRSRVRGKARELRIIGRDASIHVDYMDHGGLWLHHHPDNQTGPQWGGNDAAPRERIEIPVGEQPLTAELRAFIEHASGTREGPPLANGEVGVQGVVLIEAALESAASGVPVELD